MPAIARKPKTPLTAEQKLDIVRRAMDDKKAVAVEVIDLRERTIIADYFALCTGTSRTHIQAIVDGIVEAMKGNGMRVARREGYTQARWVLLDYGDVVAHVFAEDERDFYDLESLWQDTAARLGQSADGS